MSKFLAQFGYFTWKSVSEESNLFILYKHKTSISYPNPAAVPQLRIILAAEKTLLVCST